MTNKTISELTAATLPLNFGSLVEISIPTGPSWASAQVPLSDISFTVGSTEINLGETVTTLEGLTIGSSSTWAGNKIDLAVGGTNADLSASGGTGNVLRQSSPGATITVSPLSATELTEGTTGTGAVVRATGATLSAPLLGTPASLTLTNATGLPISTGISGLATGAAAFLATPSSANLAALLTDETGTGPNVFAVSPTFSGTITIPGSGSITSGGSLSLGSTQSIGISTDALIFRDAAGRMGLRNGANPQSWRVYNSYTDAANYDRGAFGFNTLTNVLTIGTQNAGAFTTPRGWQMVSGGVDVLDYGVGLAGAFTINAGGNRPIYIKNFSGYNALLLNGDSSTTAAGLVCGLTGDNNLYINSGMTSDIVFRNNGSTVLGSLGSTGLTIPPISAPASPSGGWRFYVDSGDGNKLKAKASTGTIVTLGVP